MIDNYSLSKCPSVTLTPVNDLDGVIKQQPTVSVHRSMSLQVQRKPDRNNNSPANSHSPGGAGSHFELANLLARAASFDAKFLRQLNEYETSERRLSFASNSSDVTQPFERSGSVVHLPDRYQNASVPGPARRRSGLRRGSSSVAPPGTSLLDTVPECTLTSSGNINDVNDSDAWKRRENDAFIAMKWLRQEIVCDCILYTCMTRFHVLFIC